MAEQDDNADAAAAEESFDFKNLKNMFKEQDKAVTKAKKKKKKTSLKTGASKAAEIATLKTENEDLKAKIEELNKKITELEGDEAKNNEKDAKIQELTQQNEKLTTDITALNEEITNLKNTVNENANAGASEDEINALKAENEKLKGENQEMKQTIEWGTNHIGGLEAKVEELNAEIATLKENETQLKENETKMIEERKEMELELEQAKSAASTSKSSSAKKKDAPKLKKEVSKNLKLGNKKSKKKSVTQLPAMNIKPGEIVKGKQPKRIINVKHPCIEFAVDVIDENGEKVLSGAFNFVLFHKERSKSVDNFLALMGQGPKKGNKNLKKKTYLKMENLIHSVGENVIIGGDVNNEDGTGEPISIYGGTFANDNSKKDCFALGKYSLVWVQNGADTNANGCQFMILMDAKPEWNLKYCCFGYMVDDKGREFADKLYAIGKRGDYVYKIPKKGVKYPLKNHLATLGNKI